MAKEGAPVWRKRERGNDGAGRSPLVVLPLLCGMH